jgi:hypothetical protein
MLIAYNLTGYLDKLWILYQKEEDALDFQNWAEGITLFSRSTEQTYRSKNRWRIQEHFIMLPIILFWFNLFSKESSYWIISINFSVSTELTAAVGGIDHQESLHPWDGYSWQGWGWQSYDDVDGCNCDNGDDIDNATFLPTLVTYSVQYSRVSGSILPHAGCPSDTSF